MFNRYIVIKITDVARNLEYFVLYKKNWIFANTHIETFLHKDDAVSLALRLIEHGEKPKKELVFDTKKDLSLDIHM